MKIKKDSKIFKTSLFLAIFAVGTLFGIFVNNGNLSHLEGYLFNAVSETNATSSNATSSNATGSNATSSNATSSNATSSNATSSNATSSNATSSNATSSNATSSNATSSNVTLYDNILYLNEFSLDTNHVEVGERLFIHMSTSGACLNGGTVILKNKDSNSGIRLNINSIEDNPYVEIPKNAMEGKYQVISVLLVGINSDNTTFSKQFAVDHETANVTYFEFNSDLEIVNTKVVEKVKLNSININDKKGALGDKVFVSYSANKELKNLKLVFVSDSDAIISVYVKSLNNNPYFIIPSNASKGTYNLISATLESDDSTVIYSNSPSIKGEAYNFDSTLEVVESSNGKVVTYDNDDLSNTVISELYSSSTINEINVNTTSNSIINAELFNVIKGKNKKLIFDYNENQMIFNGRDISTIKSIDTSIVLTTVSETDKINSLIDSGIVVNFAENGNLPGAAQVKIKYTPEMERELNGKNVYVYYFDEVNNRFNLVASDVALKDGYYDFNINHTSSYVLVTEEIDESLLGEAEAPVTFLKSDKVYLLLIVIGVLVVLGALIVILMAKGKTKENNKKKTH